MTGCGRGSSAEHVRGLAPNPQQQAGRQTDVRTWFIVIHFAFAFEFRDHLAQAEGIAKDDLQDPSWGDRGVTPQAWFPLTANTRCCHAGNAPPRPSPCPGVPRSELRGQLRLRESGCCGRVGTHPRHRFTPWPTLNTPALRLRQKVLQLKVSFSYTGNGPAWTPSEFVPITESQQRRPEGGWGPCPAHAQLKNKNKNKHKPTSKHKKWTQYRISSKPSGKFRRLSNFKCSSCYLLLFSMK